MKLEMPRLAESGNVVPVTVTVDSPMTERDYVRSIHLFAEKNNLPRILEVQLGPFNGKAVVSSRGRLAITQQVLAVAGLSDDTLWSAAAEIEVTVSIAPDDRMGKSRVRVPERAAKGEVVEIARWSTTRRVGVRHDPWAADSAQIASLSPAATTAEIFRAKLHRRGPPSILSSMPWQWKAAKGVTWTDDQGGVATQKQNS